MESGFDFEQFYVNEQVKTEAAIDRSGVNLQNPTEQAEYVTNNVVYYVYSIVATLADGSQHMLDRLNERLVIVESNTDQEPQKYYLKSMHPLGEAAGIGISPTWEPKLDRESIFTAEATDQFSYVVVNDTNPGYYLFPVSFQATVFPRHEMESNGYVDPGLRDAAGNATYPLNQGVISSPNAMKLLYGALGFYGGRWKGLGWLTKVWDKGNLGSKYLKDSAVLTYDQFKRKLDYLAGICQEAEVGFSVTYYDQSFAREVTVEDATPDDYRKNPAAARNKHSAYRIAVESADVTRTAMNRNTSFADAYSTHLDDFKQRTGYMTETGPATALVPPVTKAISAFFYPVEELEAEFSSLFKGVMDALSKVPFVWRFVSSKTRREIADAKTRYTQVPSNSERLVFDLDEVFAVMMSGPSVYHEDMAHYALPRLIQVGGQSVFGVNVFGTSSSGYPSPVMAAWSASDYVSRPTTFMTYGGAGYGVVANKSYSSVESDELVDLLVSYFNAGVDAGKITGSFRQDAEQVRTIIGMYDPATATQENYWHWWNTDNPVFGMWFLNICAYMNYMRENLAGPDTGAGMTWGGLLNVYGFLGGKTFDAWTLGGSMELFPSGTYEIIAWRAPADLESTSWEIDKLFEAEFPDEWHDISQMPFESTGMALSAVDSMHDAYRQMCRATAAQAIVIGPICAARAAAALDDISDDLETLYDVCNKLTWYQRLVGESPFTNKSGIPTGGNKTNLASFPAHLAFPVEMYKRVRVRYRNWFGRVRHKWVKRSIGVRWAEVKFYDASVFGEYAQVDEEPSETIPFSSGYETSTEGDTVYITFDEPLPGAAVDAGNCSIVANGTGGQVKIAATVLSDVMVSAPADSMPAGLGGIVSIKTPLKPSQPDGSREPVTIQFRMPGLPYDSEIRKKAFVDYGSLSQAKTFEAVRNAGIDTDRKEGWRVFHPSSSSIADVREGIGLHDKVAMLVSILKHEFGDSRVSLAETYRSMEDQQKMCSGGPESEFLSWHNYGLAAKILILKNDGKTPMEKDDPDMKRLIQVARAFTECCSEGVFGQPCNVVWCARLAIGASLFDWEFLPIGVSHKDAPRFRDIIMAQRDPVRELGYVDVDAAGYVVRSAPASDVPYVLSGSAALANAEVHAGHRFMNPDNIRNYPHVDDIVLYDAKEYVNLIKLKMAANGSSKPASGSLYDWKSMNPDSCSQLIRYYAMIGSVAASKSLLAGEYVERYLPIEEQFFNTSPIDYVKGMLGSQYEDIRICTKQDGDATFITLHDGILHIKQLDAYPDNPPTRFDMHKQQRVDKEHVKWGSWHDGVFYTEDERPVPYVDSDAPVIDGYVGGVAVDGEALLLHQVVATKIHKKFQEIKKRFESFGGALMYDRVEDGPNAGMGDMLENEFGLIKAQDLISFDDLDSIVDNGVGNVQQGRIMVDGSIYEKVVNNAQIAGVRKASLTKEHIHVKDMPTPSDGKTLYELIAKGKGYMANDLI